MATNFSSLQTMKPENSTGCADKDGLQYSNFEDHQTGIILFLVGFCVCGTLFVVIALRDYYFRKHGIDIIPNFRRVWRWRRDDDHLESDRALAEELQRRLNEDEREAERVAKRKERDEWYALYIKDYTMTVKSEDLFFAHESSSESTVPLKEGTLEEECEIPLRKRLYSTSSMEEDLEDMEDLECGVPTPTVHDPVVCNEEEEDAHLFLRLPVKGEDGICRTVDAQCAICFSDYQQGDEIVWSGLQCQHAFHRDCIFPWLGKGKKRCPMCRHWFVPGARIEDQKKALEERLRREAAENDSITEPNVGHEETRLAESPSCPPNSSTTEIANGDADATSSTDEETATEPSSTMSLDSGHESDESDHNQCRPNESDPTDHKDTSLRGRCETEEVTSEIYNNTIEAV